MRLERYFSSTLVPFGQLSKAPSLLSRAHLEWIRDRKCVATGTRTAIDAHHVLKKSQGKNDYATIPLNHKIHMEGHSRGWEQVEYEYGFDVKDALIATLVERVWLLEEALKHGRRN